jgi:hypothetical protein
MKIRKLVLTKADRKEIDKYFMNTMPTPKDIPEASMFIKIRQLIWGQKDKPKPAGGEDEKGKS